METNRILEYILLGIGGFTLTSVMALKIQVAKILENLRNADDKAIDYRSRTTQEIKDSKLSTKLSADNTLR